MAAYNISYLSMAVLLMFGIVASGGIPASAQSCYGDIQSLVLQCRQYVVKPGPKISPSAGCCDIVKKIDTNCVCPLVTKEVEQFISMEKALYVAENCGRTLPHGTKCGSFTVPLA